MRLLYITNGINGAGGLERVLSVKASYLAEHYGYEVTILTLNERHPGSFYSFSPKVALHSITVTGNPIAYIKSYLEGVKKTVKEIQPDLISVCDDGLKGFFIPFALDKVGGVLWDKIFRKEIIVKNGIFFNTTIRLSEDLLFVLEYLKHTNKVSVVKKHLYHYNRIDQNGLSKQYTLNQFVNITEVNRIVLNLVQCFDIDVKLVSSYLEKRRNGFLIQYCIQITTNKNTFFLKKKKLEDLRLHEEYNFNFGLQSIRLIDYPIVFFMNIKNYTPVIYYCSFLNRIKIVLNK